MKSNTLTKILVTICLIFVVVGIVKVGDMIGPGQNSKLEQMPKGHFPKLIGIDLLGKERLIPHSFAGKMNLILIGFKRDHQTPMNTWITYFDEGKVQAKGIRLYEIPLIDKQNMAYRLWINNGMRAGIPDEKSRERTITVYTNKADFLEAMDMNPEKIYVLLLDGKGKILWRTEGALDSANQKKFEAALKKDQP